MRVQGGGRVWELRAGGGCEAAALRLPEGSRLCRPIGARCSPRRSGCAHPALPGQVAGRAGSAAAAGSPRDPLGIPSFPPSSLSRARGASAAPKWRRGGAADRQLGLSPRQAGRRERPGRRAQGRRRAPSGRWAGINVCLGAGPPFSLKRGASGAGRDRGAGDPPGARDTGTGGRGVPGASGRTAPRISSLCRAPFRAGAAPGSAPGALTRPPPRP